MTTEPHWTAYLTALLTPIVALGGAYIAWRQSRTAQNKLKFDLFTRRFSVYDASRNLISSIMTSGQVKEEALQQFAAGTREARWLFDKNVENYLREELWQKALDLQCLNEELNDLHSGGERTDRISKRAEIKKWFYRQYEVLDEKFSPFLKLEH